MTFAGVSVEGTFTYFVRALQSAHTNAVMMHASVADWMGRTADAPIFHPTQEEWENPMAFIRSIRPRAELHGERLRTFARACDVRSAALPALPERLPTLAGICKIIPPTTSTVPASRVSVPVARCKDLLDIHWLASRHCGPSLT